MIDPSEVKDFEESKKQLTNLTAYLNQVPEALTLNGGAVNDKNPLNMNMWSATPVMGYEADKNRIKINMSGKKDNVGGELVVDLNKLNSPAERATVTAQLGKIFGWNPAVRNEYESAIYAQKHGVELDEADYAAKPVSVYGSDGNVYNMEYDVDYAGNGYSVANFSYDGVSYKHEFGALNKLQHTNVALGDQTYQLNQALDYMITSGQDPMTLVSNLSGEDKALAMAYVNSTTSNNGNPSLDMNKFKGEISTLMQNKEINPNNILLAAPGFAPAKQELNAEIKATINEYDSYIKF
jgi:hypothetical protein